MADGPVVDGGRRPLATAGLIAVGVFAVSLSGPLMASIAVPALAIAFWRNALATLVLAPVALLRRRAELARLFGTREGRSDLRWTAAAGAALALHFGAWIPSLSMTSVAASTAIVCTQVGWVVAWDRFTGVRVPLVVVLGVLLAFGGVLVISGIDVQVSTRALAGDLLALVGSVAVAAYTVIGSRARRTVSTTGYTVVCYGVAALGLLAATLVSGQRLVGFGPREWALLALVTGTAQLLGHSVFNLLLDQITPMLVSLALLLEIPGAALLAAVLLGQVPSAGVFVGLAMILAGLAVVVSRGGPARSDAVALSA